MGFSIDIRSNKNCSTSSQGDLTFSFQKGFRDRVSFLNSATMSDSHLTVIRLRVEFTEKGKRDIYMEEKEE